ncbi:hypothetical protein MPSI1_000481 [Malassezia psittaci]|uniref:Domain of unknown function at the cortex 1 domain-containing protein n=1 Tax=Malassezia psittaci TaxID=1821823 RepID=A0AAF0F2Z8_9BASI|nr:hypothetical protein MPSI1_000481 [Malassezia psittaci]
MPRLEVKVGPDRFHMEAANVNDFLNPNEINSPYFCGRVLVRILNAPGAQEGQPGREYFQDRTRKFCIQIEGRFRHEWSGDDILFGTDFDKFVPFPRAPFNAGMHVARLIDPCTYYEEHPPSGRPYIMSPYLACMNVFCAWPAPDHMENAVIVYYDQDHEENTAYTVNPLTYEHKHEGDIVPVERLSNRTDSPAPEKSHGWLSNLIRSSHDDRVTDHYWRFVGFRDDPKIGRFLDLLPSSEKQLDQPSASSPSQLNGVQAATEPARPLATAIYPEHANNHQVSPAIVAPRPIVASGGASGSTSAIGSRSATPSSSAITPDSAVSIDSSTVSHPPPQRTGTPSVGKKLASKSHRLWHGIDKNMLVSLGSSKKSSGNDVNRNDLNRPNTPQLPEFSSSTMHHDADWSASFNSAAPITNVDSSLAQAMNRTQISSQSQSVEQQLGPWRFSDPGSDMTEDNAFVFLDKSVSVSGRRRHFANAKNRTDFKYDPNVVYGASFFSNFMDFNTFDLAIGPVRINVSPYFKEMPIRYSLRCKHNEEITFCAIEFRLVDD